MAVFITFEGGEGCGKSTQTRILLNQITRSGRPAILVREPGGTPLGEKVRRILMKCSSGGISPLTELILFNASRSQLVADVIRPALQSGVNVICDRFTDSTLAYQSFGRGLDIETVNTLNTLAAQQLKPDLTILLDIPPEVGLRRKKTLNSDRFEGENIEFHRKVRRGFLELASRDAQRWITVDATLSLRVISGVIWEKVQPRLSR